MDQHLTNSQNALLWELLANPANNGPSYVENLQSLVNEFPQSGILHALLARADSRQDVIKRSVVYFDPKLLHKLVTSPASLAVVNEDQLIIETSPVKTEDAKTDDSQLADSPPQEHNHISPENDTETDTISYSEDITGEQAADLELNSSDQYEAARYEAGTSNSHDIEDDVYDEIVGIDDISFDQVPAPAADLQGVDKETSFEPAESKEIKKERRLDLNDEAEKLIVGNIAATDYFIFDRALSESKKDVSHGKDIKAAPGSSDQLNHSTDEETQEVARYHDDKMPYSFMWWLDKTRREHADTYQPYVNTGSVVRRAPDELQQQYVENIFHLNAVEELDRSTGNKTVEFDMKRKEDVIIERFIHEEPHINPPSADKLDNENKAKKSAIDSNELVTETLAQIYCDQMLYHKAIVTYKKLMLKFPEKSRYFADQIEQLEKKTN